MSEPNQSDAQIPGTTPTDPLAEQQVQNAAASQQGSAPNQADPQAEQQTQNDAANQQGSAPRLQPQGGDLPITISKIEDNVHRYMKQAFVLANLYYFFQGAILTAVSQVSSPKCNQWYFFLVLSLIPLTLNGFPLIYVLYKCAKAKNEHDRYILLDEQRRSSGAGGAQSDETRAAQTDVYWKTIRYIGIAFAAFILIAFNAVMLYGCRSLLCENTQTSPTLSYDGACFRVCNDQNKCLKICTE